MTRAGPHVMLALTAGSQPRAMYERWITTARPPVVKFCRQGMDSALMAWTRAQGSRIVGRYVDVALVSSGAENGRLARKVIGELTPFMDRLDYIEFANEEMQGKDDPRQWDTLMAACLDFMRQLDDANRAAGRKGPKACIANTSVGQPELARWSRESTLEAARYAAANGHVWGHHEYYKPDPWAMIDGGKAAWDGAAPAEGWLLMRVAKVARIMRSLGIDGYRFIITESGRDNVPGQPGQGGGFRDVMPGHPYAEFMAQYGRHLSAIPECIGWVDFGYNAWQGWKQFDLTEEPAEHERMVQAMAKLPRGAPSPPAPQPQPETPMPTNPPTIPKPAAAHSSRGGARARYVILHSTDSPAGATPTGTANYLQSNDRLVSVHELVNPEATYIMVPDNRAAHHAGADSATLPDGTKGGAVNAASWGLEIYQVNGRPTDPALVERAAVRVADAARRLGIPAANVLMHREVDPGRRSDPVGVDADAFRRRVAELLGTAPEAPAPGRVDYGKLVWAIEEATRILEREGRAVEAGYIKSVILPPLVKERDKPR